MVPMMLPAVVSGLNGLGPLKVAAAVKEGGCVPGSRCRKAGRCGDGSAKRALSPRAPCAVSAPERKKDEMPELSPPRCGQDVCPGHGKLLPCHPSPAETGFRRDRVWCQR